MSEISPVADCANCKPSPHPRSKHAAGGYCIVEFCPCMHFVELAPAAAPEKCYVCGMRSHGAGKRCPYVRSPK